MKPQIYEDFKLWDLLNVWKGHGEISLYAQYFTGVKHVQSVYLTCDACTGSPQNYKQSEGVINDLTVVFVDQNWLD